MIIAVAGCVAQAEGEVILDRAPYVDMVFGPQTYHELPEMVARIARTAGGGLLNTDFPSESKFDFLPEESRRSEEHTSELQSLMRISYAVFCLKKQKTIQKNR